MKEYRPLQWADWLRRKAVSGDQDALAALRARDMAERLRNNTIEASGVKTASPVTAIQDGVTKKGTIIYRIGASAVRDDGNKLNVSRGADTDGLTSALLLAMERYGNRITVNGTEAFRSQIVHATVAARLDITFANADLEQQRQSLLSTTTKEYTRESRSTHLGLPTGGGAGIARPTGANRTDADIRGRRGHAFPGPTAKPNIGGIGITPPPSARNCLRNLSDVAVVRLDSGSKVLLQNHVLNNVEQQGTTSDHTLRRPISWNGLEVEAITAAESYIKGRNEKLALNIDISKHKLYNNDVGIAVFSGIRRIDGHSMALLRQGNDVVVMPIQNAVADRLKRLSIGTEVVITNNGTIKKRAGRRR